MKITKEHIDFYFYIKGQAGSFSTALWDAMQRADWVNIQKFSIGFPEEYQAFIDWRDSESEQAFLDAVSANFSNKE